MKVLLDTNFILSCVKQKIDFLSQLSLEYTILVPEEVIDEIKTLKEDKKLKVRDREATKIALELLDNKKIELIKLGEKVDDGILRYVEEMKKEGESIFVATLDKELKQRLKGKTRILAIRMKKKLDFV